MDNKLFHKQILEHIVLTQLHFDYTPSPEQIYIFAKRIYNDTFSELIVKEELDKYIPDNTYFR